MHVGFWGFVFIVAVIVALILWGIQSLNPHAFNKAAGQAVKNAATGVSKDLAAGATAVAKAAESKTPQKS